MCVCVCVCVLSKFILMRSVSTERVYTFALFIQGGRGKSQWAYVGSYTTFVFYIRGLLLNADGILYLLVRGFRRQNLKNSNILDHAHLILKHLYCWL